MQAQNGGRDDPHTAPDLALWRQCRDATASENEFERLLDLAAFAEGRLDDDDSERVAALLAADAEAAEDVAAARTLATGTTMQAASPQVIARATALVSPGSSGAEIVSFRSRQRVALAWHGVARWGSLAAAVAVASWLGFSLGSTASLAFGPGGHGGDDVSLGEMLDPGSGGFGDFGDRSST